MKTTKTTFKLATLGVLGLSTIIGSAFPAAAAPVAAAPVAAAPVTAQHARHGAKHDGAFAGLDLTTEQKAQIKAISQDQKARILTVNSDTSLSPAAKKAQIKAIRADGQARINAVLTPAQQAKLKANRQEKRAHKRERKDDLAELNLTADQKAQIKAIHQNAKAQVAEVRTNSSLSDAEKKAQIKSIRVNSLQQVNALLTPEQQAKLAQMRRDRRADKREHKQHGAPQNNGGLNG